MSKETKKEKTMNIIKRLNTQIDSNVVLTDNNIEAERQRFWSNLGITSTEAANPVMRSLIWQLRHEIDGLTIQQENAGCFSNQGITSKITVAKKQLKYLETLYDCKMNAYKKWQIGDMVWIKDSRSDDYAECRIIKKWTGTNNKEYVELKNMLDSRTYLATTEQIYENRYELVQKDVDNKNAYCNNITDKDDLIRFMLEKFVNENNTIDDKNAKAAVFEKIAEFKIETTILTK